MEIKIRSLFILQVLHREEFSQDLASTQSLFKIIWEYM